MPLKHATETRLVVVLGGAIIGVGFALRLLPPPPDGAFFLGGLLLLTLGYPLCLLPLFRARRADYALRFLHFLPFLLLLIWSVFPMVRLPGVPADALMQWYAWKHGFLPIVGSLLLLFLYCLHVIRQRISRSVAFILFLFLFVVAVRGEGGAWRIPFGSWRNLVAFSPPEISLESASPTVNTEPSSSLGEEVWRMRLRRMHRRQGRLLEDDGLVDRPSLPAKGVPVLLQAGSSSSTPPTLVSSGIGLEWGIVLLLALYTGVLHARTRRRSLLP